MSSVKSDYRYAELDPPCFYCQHLLQIGTQKSLEGWTCRAYPEGIPYVILTRQADHTERLPGQEDDSTFQSKEYDFDGKPHRITFAGDWEEVSE